MKLKRSVRDWLHHKLMPPLDWLQVEVSSVCDGACIYCPHTIYKNNWIESNMTPETFQRLVPVFPKVGLVHLQGWGEPFLNPDIFEMLRMAKSAGCRVGTTTNGMHLDEDKIERLVECGLDILAFSLAGTDHKNDDIRQGTRLETVLKMIDLVNAAKARHNSPSPAVHIAYMLLRSGLDDLPKLPEFVNGRGINQVVVTTLDFVARREIEDETVIPRDESEFDAIEAQLKEVAVAVRSFGSELRYYLYHPKARGRFCTENVQRALFVSADGSVAPCVFMNIPIQDAYYRVKDDRREYQPLIFGNVNHEKLPTIWRKDEYVEFRGSFELGRHPKFCGDCRKLKMMEG
jgi:MoaA/NifB/PqqE/SkfB family radical SAM enzyme